MSFVQQFNNYKNKYRDIKKLSKKSVHLKCDIKKYQVKWFVHTVGVSNCFQHFRYSIKKSSPVFEKTRSVQNKIST